MLGRLRRGVRRLSHYAIEPMNYAALHARGRDIRDLARAFHSRSGSVAGIQLVLREDRSIDYEHSAGLQRERAVKAYQVGRLPVAAYEQLATLTAGEFRLLLDKRLTSTARRSCTWLVAAGTLFVSWVWRVCHEPLAYTSFVYVLGWLAVCAFCLVSAGLAAYANWQIRAGRVGGFTEFLLRADSLWPAWRR
ncbi:MAG: hypothetical protein JOY71_02785 [Acetobacteraceae bacterium]|nr:hypothetical protein [Acetobacteraceae bacterium]